MPETKSRTRTHLLALLFAASPTTVVLADPPTEVECHRDRELMLDALAAARAEGVRRLDIAISTSTSAEERAGLIAERDELWDVEERDRVFADTNWRDCLRHVRSRRARVE